MPVSTGTSSKQNPRHSGEQNMRYDLCGFICPLSKVKAIEIIDSLADRETAELILGDTDSLKSVVQELKTKGIRPAFKKEGENRFVLTITKQEG
jgi:hypothetical protein